MVEGLPDCERFRGTSHSFGANIQGSGMAEFLP